MTWLEALDGSLASHEAAGRLRELCDDRNPDVAQKDAYRVLVVSLATGGIPDPRPTRAIPIPLGRCCG